MKVDPYWFWKKKIQTKLLIWVPSYFFTFRAQCEWISKRMGNITRNTHINFHIDVVGIAIAQIQIFRNDINAIGSFFFWFFRFFLFLFFFLFSLFSGFVFFLFTFLQFDLLLFGSFSSFFHLKKDNVKMSMIIVYKNVYNTWTTGS